MTFSDVLKAIGKLTDDELEALVKELHCLVRERRHAEIVREVADAQAEMAAGRANITSVEEIMDESDEQIDCA
jgi:hypothetical protein